MSERGKVSNWLRGQLLNIPLAVVMMVVAEHYGALSSGFRHGLTLTVQGYLDAPYQWAAVRCDYLPSQMWEGVALIGLAVGVDTGSAVFSRMQSQTGKRSASSGVLSLRRGVSNMAAFWAVVMLLQLPIVYKVYYVMRVLSWELTVATPVITSHQKDLWLAEWARMNNGEDYKRLMRAMEAVIKANKAADAS